MGITLSFILTKMSLVLIFIMLVCVIIIIMLWWFGESEISNILQEDHALQSRKLVKRQMFSYINLMISARFIRQTFRARWLFKLASNLPIGANIRSAVPKLGWNISGSNEFTRLCITISWRSAILIFHLHTELLILQTCTNKTTRNRQHIGRAKQFRLWLLALFYLETEEL